jgi:anti-sigma B factor antagonist
MARFSVRSSSPDAGQCVIRIAGEVDLEHSAELAALGRDALGTDAGLHTLVIDLADVTFMDSTGVGALIEIHAAAMAADVQVCIRHAPPVVTKILQITGLAAMFRVENNGNRAQLSSRDDLE